MSAATPSRFAISLATSTSNPFHSAFLTSYQDCGLYFWSVATRISPLLQRAANASDPFVSTPAHTPVPPVADLLPAAVVVPLEHAAAIIAKTAMRAPRPWNRYFRMHALLPGDAAAPRSISAGL